MITDFKRILIRNKLGIVLVGAYFFAAQILFSYVCPSMWFVGVPCPACGLTRAALRLLRLDFAGAWGYNPAIFLVPPAVYCYFTKRAGFFTAIIVILCVIFFIRLATSFGTEPLIINENALLIRLIRFALR